VLQDQVSGRTGQDHLRQNEQTVFEIPKPAFPLSDASMLTATM
jgi:hypothetical protein